MSVFQQPSSSSESRRSLPSGGLSDLPTIFVLLILAVAMTVLAGFTGLSYWDQQQRRERVEERLRDLHEECVAERKASEALLKLVDVLLKERRPVGPFRPGGGTGSVGSEGPQ